MRAGPAIGRCHVFGFWRAGFSLRASGAARRIPCEGVDALEAATRAWFASDVEGKDGLLVGAMPFDRAGPVVLVQPEQVEWGTGGDGALPAAAPSGIAIGGLSECPPASVYADRVRHALRDMAASGGALRKVVLARGLRIEAGAPVDPFAIVARLAADESVTTFLADLAAEGAGGATLVGATPELLLSRRGRTVLSHPLAGSARRHAGEAEDRQAADALLRSEKDRREHALVVEAILDLLAPHCARLDTPEGTGLRSTATMWHLGTRIEGELKSDDAPSAAGLAALLHPTPAVGGYPRDAALEVIRGLEPEGRGYYAGALGWVDARGDGEWHVTLRCALVEGGSLMLHAGAGIVPGSDPDAEVAETAAKFRAMLQALGVDERDAVLEKVA